MHVDFYRKLLSGMWTPASVLLAAAHTKGMTEQFKKGYVE